ncbi:aldo/keto reductase [Sphingomonas oligophenolica]|uniref:Aldo/keto reductase n=1 Tax=Sphingomonas oligophenolica TaxID=301154 RepID=A0A502CJ57_9SPHN|nr:aldo/keto reductase [Sphingomonas oligophenolica]TPG13675.1 aldo/keto reductase [Sphingomonas oligophenolica]
MINLTLNDGRTMPQLGMGTYQVPETQAAMVVRQGLDTGFRLVDTAAIYGNERGVGQGMQGTDVFLTTKLWNDRQGDPAAALDESLALLGVDAVDLYLIHWPAPGQAQYVGAWKALIDLRAAGKTRSIGVSNFLPDHLDAIIGATGVTPVVNQIELHPDFQQRELRAYHADHAIVTQSWSPIGQGKTLLDNGTIVGIADKHARSAAQVVIAWHLAHGLAPIPKASSPDHLSDNVAALDLTLDDEDMTAIDALDRADGRMGPDPRSM